MNRSRELLAHIARVEAENATERFMQASNGRMEEAYRGVTLPVGAGGWARVWCFAIGGVVVAHASVVDLGWDDIVGGHISIERPYRGRDIAKRLQETRFSFLDAHQLTLLGPIEVGNDASWFGCRRAGFEFSHYDPVKRQIWVHRLPTPLA